MGVLLSMINGLPGVAAFPGILNVPELPAKPLVKIVTPSTVILVAFAVAMYIK